MSLEETTRSVEKTTGGKKWGAPEAQATLRAPLAPMPTTCIPQRSIGLRLSALSYAYMWLGSPHFPRSGSPSFLVLVLGQLEMRRSPAGIPVVGAAAVDVAGDLGVEHAQQHKRDQRHRAHQEAVSAADTAAAYSSTRRRRPLASGSEAMCSMYVRRNGRFGVVCGLDGKLLAWLWGEGFIRHRTVLLLVPSLSVLNTKMCRC